MANNMHKGSELNNVNETWKENEQKKDTEGVVPSSADKDGNQASSDLEQAVKEEALEYDKANKEERLLGGDRETVNDEPGE